MGGLALKHLGVQRVPSARYLRLVQEVTLKFSAVFGHRPTVIPAYATKPDFGDCDLLVTTDLPSDWREEFGPYVASRGWVRNGDVTSMEIAGVQFDFISVAPETQQFAFTYFAFNDLGNLMGRIAHKMGFKYGQQGLYYPLRVGDHLLDDVLVSRDVAQVFDFLGYKHNDWLRGFDTLEDIFKFVASSRYFSPEIYLLHNRNAKARMRDAKRKSYTDFLVWCASEPHPHLWTWETDPVRKAEDRSAFLLSARERWPEFSTSVGTQLGEYQRRLDLKTKWNGSLVSEWTKLSGKPLGHFMAKVRAHPDFDIAARSVYTLHDLVTELYETSR